MNLKQSLLKRAYHSFIKSESLLSLFFKDNILFPCTLLKEQKEQQSKERKSEFPNLIKDINIQIHIKKIKKYEMDPPYNVIVHLT